MAKKQHVVAPYGRLQPATYHLCHRSVWYDPLPLHASLLIVCAVVPRPQGGSDAIRSMGNDGISKGWYWVNFVFCENQGTQIAQTQTVSRQTYRIVLFSSCDLTHLFLQNKLYINKSKFMGSWHNGNIMKVMSLTSAFYETTTHCQMKWAMRFRGNTFQVTIGMIKFDSNEIL